MSESRPLPGHSLLARLTYLVALLGCLFLLTVALASNIGPVPIPIAVVFASAKSYLAGRPFEDPGNLALIFWHQRLPRVVLGAVVGSALAVSGGALQGLLMNPLADPYLVGVSAGAALGASIAIVAHLDLLLGGVGKCVIAFGSGILTMMLVLWLARSRGRVERNSFILAGVVVGSFMWALVTVVMTAAKQDLASVVLWLMGNLSGETDWVVVAVVTVVVGTGCVALYACARDLNLLALGEEGARHLGVDVEVLKLAVIVFTALITAAAVSVSGLIGFIGLVVPHMARKLFGPDHRVLLPTAGLLGAIFLIWADTVARSVGETFPVGVLTALLGAPFFFYLLKRKPRTA
jgi:iron complex transport system permease protein